MMKRGRGRPCRPKKTSVTCSTDAEFFKVFIPHLSSQKLRIPPDFVKDFSRIIMKDKIILKDMDGKVWYVDVAKTLDGVFLKKGWQSFVSHHSLKAGDFLVFRYDRNHIFSVKIFGTNGCKKEPAAAKHVKIEKSEEEIEANQSSCKRACGHKEDHLSRDDERTEHSTGLEEINELENVASKLPESCSNVTPAYRIIPNHPCFVSSPCGKLNQYNVRIPNILISGYKLQLNQEMVLRNADGKEWPVHVYKTTDGRVYIGKGLATFHKDNNVGSNDRCVFTFETERLSNTIYVNVFH